MKVSKVTFAYPFSNEFNEMLIQYVLIESRALYRKQVHTAIHEASVRDRILRILIHIFNALFESKMVPPKEIFEKSAKAIINIFIEIKRDYGVNNKLMEDITIKLLKRTGLFEKIEALKGKNLPCPLDTFLTDHAYSDIYKTTITSDYGTDDGYQMDDDVQIVDDDIVDITARERNEIKEEDSIILNKASTSPLTKSVPTICLDDSDFEETCFADEVQTSKKSLEYQRHQRQEDKVSFHKRNHRPMDDVKTETIKLDMSEECNFINSNSKPVNSDVSHSEANLISNKTIVIKCDGIQSYDQSNNNNRNRTKSVTIETEIVEISDEENEVETYDTGSSVFKEQNTVAKADGNIPNNINRFNNPTDFSVVVDVTDPSSEILESSNNSCYAKLESGLLITVEDDFEEDLTEQQSTSTQMKNDKLKMADQQSNSNCPIDSEEFESTTVSQNMIKERLGTSHVNLISKDGKLNEESLIEFVETIPEKDPGSQVEDSNIEKTNGLDSSRSGESHEIEHVASSTHEIEHIASSSDLHDDKEIEEISEAVAVGENNPRVVEVDSVEQPTTDSNSEPTTDSNSDSCSMKTTKLIEPSLQKINFEKNEVLSEFDNQLRESNQENKKLPCRKDVGFVSNEVENINQSNTAVVSDFKNITEASNISNPVVSKINLEARDSAKESGICYEDSSKISDDTESTSTTHIDTLPTESVTVINLSVDEIKTSNPDLHSSESVNDTIFNDVETDEKLLENLETSFQLEENNSTADGIDCAIEVINNNQSESVICQESPVTVLFDIGTSREPNYDESKSESICNSDSSSNTVTNGTLDLNNLAHQDRHVSVMIDNNNASKDCEDGKDNLLFSKLIIDGTESNKDEGDLLSLPKTSISNENQGGDLLEEKFNTLVNEKVVIKDLVEMGSHIPSLRQIAQNIIQTNSSGESLEQLKSSDIQEIGKIPSTSVVTSKEGEKGTAEDTGCAPNPEQSNIEEMCVQQIITGEDTLHENDVIEVIETNVKAINNSGSQPTDEMFSKQNNKEKPEDKIIDDTLCKKSSSETNSICLPYQTDPREEVEQFENPYKSKQLHEVDEVRYSGAAIMDKPQKSCTQENIDGTFPNENSDHEDELAEDQNPKGMIKEAFQSTQPQQGTTVVEKSNTDEQFFNKNSEFAIEVEVVSDVIPPELHIKHIIPNVCIDSHDGEQKSCLQENVKSHLDETSPNDLDHSDELIEGQKPTEMIKGAFQTTQPFQDKTLVEKSNIDEQIFNTDSEFAIEVEVESDEAQSEFDVRHIIPNVSSDSHDGEQKSCIPEISESNNERTLPNKKSDHSDELSKDQNPTDTMLVEKSNIDEQLINKDSEFEPNEKSGHSDELTEDPNHTEIVEEAFQTTLPLQDTTLTGKSNNEEQLFNKDSEFAIEVEVESDNAQSELDVMHIIPYESIDSHDGKQKSCILEIAESNIDGTLPNKKSDHSDKLAEDQNPTEIIEGAFQTTRPLQDIMLMEKSNIDEQNFNKDSEFANEVEVGSDDAESELDVNQVIPNVSIVSHDGEHKSCIQENVESNIDETVPNEKSDLSYELAENKIPAEVLEGALQSTQPLEDTTLVEKSNTDEQLFNKDSECAVEVGSDDTQSEFDVMHTISKVSIVSDELTEQITRTSSSTCLDSERDCMFGETSVNLKLKEAEGSIKVKSKLITDRRRPQDSLHSDRENYSHEVLLSIEKAQHFANDKEKSLCNVVEKLCEEETIKESEFDENSHNTTSTGEFIIKNNDHEQELLESEYAIEVEIEMEDNQFETGSSLKDQDFRFAGEYAKEVTDSEVIKNENVESERQSIQGNFETNITEEDKNQDIPLNVEYASKSCEKSDHKVEDKAKIGENPTALAKIEELFQKSNEHLLEFHSEFAVEVEIGTEDGHPDADTNNIGKLCNVTDQNKIVQGDSFIEDQMMKSATEKLPCGRPDQNEWRVRENLHTSIITESQDIFGQHDSGIASNSGSSDDQDNQSLQADLESQVDLSLLLKRNGVDNFVQNDVTSVPQVDFYPLDVLAGVAAEAPRERVIEEQKPLRRGRSSKAENDNVSELFEKVMFNRKKQPSSLKVSKCKDKIEQTPKPRTHQTARKVVKTSVNDNIRVTRSSHMKNSNENLETSFKPHDFLSIKNLTPPANKLYADRIVDVNFTSEDSNDSESNKLMIDEGASAKSKDIKLKSLLDPLGRDEVGRHMNEGEDPNTKSKDMKSDPLQVQLGEYEVDGGINDVSMMPDHQIEVDEVENNNLEDIVKDVDTSIYDEDSLDEELHFCYEPNLEPIMSVQQNNEDFIIAEVHQQLPPEDKKVVSISRSSSASVKNSKTLFESNKPFRTKAERKVYNQLGPNPYISIERLNVSTTEKNVPIGKQNRSKSLDIGIISNIGSKSKRLHSKEKLKDTPSIKVEPEEKTVENTESVMIANITEDINNTELTEDNITIPKLSENSERNKKVNERGDFDETPLAERIKKETQESLAKSSIPEEIAIKSKQKSKRLKKKWKTTKKKRATKINKLSAEPKVQDAAEPKKEESDELANKTILQEKKPTAVFHALSPIDSKQVDNIQIKFENLEESSNRNYYTLPKLRRKSMSKDNLSRSVTSATTSVSTSDIKDEGKQCMPPPKLRGKASANSERFKEQNTKLKWKCKNTVIQTTEKLKKKLCEEVPTDADVELQLISNDNIEEQVDSSYLAVDIEIPLPQKPLVKNVEQSQYKLCKRNLIISDIPPESEFSNLVNPLLKQEISSDNIPIQNSANSTSKDSLFENNNESNDIVYDLSWKPHRKVHNHPDTEKPDAVTEVEEIPIFSEHENVVTVDVFTEQEEDKGKLASSSNEKLMVYESDFASVQIPMGVQKNDLSTESKNSVDVESVKPDIDNADIENSSHLPSGPSEELADILLKPDSPEENKVQPSGDCNPENLKVEHKSMGELSSPSKKKLETVSKLDLNNKSITSVITDSCKNKSFNNLLDLNAESFKNVIESDSKTDVKECEKTETDIATNLSQTDGEEKYQTSSKAPDLPNESNQTPDLPNDESECIIKCAIKTKLEKRKCDYSTESSKEKKRRKSRKVESDLNVASSTSTVNAENCTDATLIGVVPGFEDKETQEKEQQKINTASSLGIRRMQINHKLKASKSPSTFVDVLKSKKLQSKQTDSISDDNKYEVATEEIIDEVSQLEPVSTPELNVCLDFSSKKSKSKIDLSVQEISPIVLKEVQSEESTTEVSSNSGEINEDLLISTSETKSSTLSPKKTCLNSDDKSHSSLGKIIDSVKSVQQEVQDEHITEKVKKKSRTKSKSQVRTAKDGEEDTESDSTQNSFSRSTRLNASKIASEIKEPYAEKINEVVQVSESKPLQKTLKRSLSRSCTDDVDEGMEKNHKKLNKTCSELQPRSYSHGGIETVKENLKKSEKENLKKSEKENSTLETRLSLRSRSDSSINKDVLEVDNEEIVKDQNNTSTTISRLSPLIENSCEKSKSPSEQVQNMSISVQKPDSEKTMNVAKTASVPSQAPQTGDLKKSCGPVNITNDSAVLKISQNDDYSNNENQTGVDFQNKLISSDPVSLQETENSINSDNTKTNQEFCLDAPARSCTPDHTNITDPEACLEPKETVCISHSLETVHKSDSENKEIPHDLDSSVVNNQKSLPQDKEMPCDQYDDEKNLQEKERFCGHDCLDNIKQGSFSKDSEISAIHSLDSTLQNSEQPLNETSTNDSSIMESESVLVSNEIEFGHNVVVEKSNNEFVDEYEVANTDVTITDNTSTIDKSNAELMANTGNCPLSSGSKYVETDLISNSLKSESIQITDGNSGFAKNVPAPLFPPDLIVEKSPVINTDFLGSKQELSGIEVVKINVHEETSQNTALPNTCKRRKRIISSDPDSEKPADESNAGKSTMTELTILIDNSTAVANSSPLSESPRKRERKSIEFVVNHLKEKERENCSSFDSTNPVIVESDKSNWVNSTDGGCNRVLTDFNSSLWMKSDEIPDIHSEVVVSSDQPALISSSLPQEKYKNQVVDARYTMSYETNHPIKQEALGKTTANIVQVASCNNDLNPLNFIPDDDTFGLGDSRQSTSIEQSSKTSSLSEERPSDKLIKTTNLNPTESSANDANVKETFHNLANLRNFGKASYFKMQTNATSFVGSSIVHGNGGNDKPDFAQMVSVDSTADHNSSEIGQPETLTSIYNSSLSRNKEISKLEHYTGYAADTSNVSTSNSDSRSERVSATTIKSFNSDNSTTSDISLNYHDISPSQTLDLISTQNYQLNQNILGQISRANSFITGVSGSSNEITDIIPVSKQPDFSHSFKDSYERNNSDHSYYFPADPVMSCAGEDIFPKGMSDASSELLSNDNPLRDFELSDDFSDFLNTKQVSEEKDSEEKDSESNQNDDYKLRIDNETITQNLVEMSRSRQSKEIIELYDLLDSDKMEPDYTAEPSRDPGLWESIIESDQSTQKVIVLPNNHCPTSPFDMTHTDLLENDQSTQKAIVEPNNHCLTPTFNMSHTDLYNSFDVSPPRAQCYNPMPPVKSQSVDSLLKETVCTSLADFEKNSSTLGTSEKDPKKDSPADLKKPQKTKKSTPKKIEKDLKGIQPDNILPTRSYGRTKPSKWIKSSNQLSIDISKVNQSSSPVEKQDPNADSSTNSSKEVVSTNNLLNLSFTKSTRILPEKPIVIQGIAATKPTEIASTRIANTPSVCVNEQTRQTISKPDTPKTKAETPIIQTTARNLNLSENVYSLTKVNANIAQISKSSGAELLQRVTQYKVTPIKHDHKLSLRKLSHEYNLGEGDRNFSSAIMKDFEHDAVVQNIADIVKSRKRVATNLYSSRPLSEENVKNSSHYRPKRRKTPTELNFNGKVTMNVKTKTAVNSPVSVAEVVESDISRRSQSRGSTRSSAEPTSEAEDPLRKRLKVDEKTPQDLHPKPAGSKYSVNYSIERILGKDSISTNESRHTNEGPVKDCRERDGRDLTRSSSGTGIKNELEVGKTESSATEDAFDRLIRHKNETPSFPHREHSTLREKKYHKPDPAYRNNERCFNIEKSHRERIPREGSTRGPSASHDQRSQERDSRAGNKRYPAYQGHSRDPYPPYPPEQRRSSGGYYPSTGSSRHSNHRQHSGVSSSRSNVSQPFSSTPQQNSRSSLSSSRGIIEGEEHKWAARLIDRGLLDPLSESTPQFFPQKSPRDK